MFPTGVRLVVPSVKSYAEYTCRVTNEAGSANVTAYIYAVSCKCLSLFWNHQQLWGSVQNKSLTCGYGSVVELNSWFGGCRFEPHQKHYFVFVSMTLYSLLSTDSYRHVTEKMFLRNQNKQTIKRTIINTYLWIEIFQILYILHLLTSMYVRFCI